MSLPTPATEFPASPTGIRAGGSLSAYAPQAAQTLEPQPLKKGLRQTEQRKAVFEALMANADHPSAVEVFMRVKNRMPTISLATVYNCLETLTDNGLVRAVNHEREPSRFCANLQEHAHLFCSQCASVTDIPLHTHTPPEQIWKLPAGITITQQEVSFRGLCAKCATTQSA